MLQHFEQLQQMIPCGMKGCVERTDGSVIHATEFNAPVGAVVEIERQSGNSILGEVIGFRENKSVIYPYSDIRGVRPGNLLTLKQTTRRLSVGHQLIGRVVDALGRPVDGKGGLPSTTRVPLERKPPDPITRPTIDSKLSTGIRAIDGLLTCGVGQRMGIFAGAGVGKSVLLGMMSKYSSADVNVIGLIGERGREVNEFIHRDLGPEGLAKSVVVLATSDEPALLRVQAAMTTTAIAEYFRDQGCNVLMMMDSLTRVAMAQREIGLAAGEPPTTRGYPPSVYSLLPRLVERAGRSDTGSITAFYSVLVEGDDTNEPISDAVRGLIDGHTLLSRKIASVGRYPAIDVLESISRLMTEVADPDHLNAANRIRRLMSVYREHEDLISINAYRQGTNPEVDRAIAAKEAIEVFLSQRMDEHSTGTATREMLVTLANAIAP